MQSRLCPLCGGPTKVSVGALDTGAALFSIYCPSCKVDDFENFVKAIAIITDFTEAEDPFIKMEFQRPGERDDQTLKRLIEDLEIKQDITITSKARLGSIRDSGARYVLYEINCDEADLAKLLKLKTAARSALYKALILEARAIWLSQ